MLSAAKLPSSPVGVARALPGLFDTLLVEEGDLTSELRADLAPLVANIVGAQIVMHDDAARLSLAQRLLQVASDAA
jgi:hypothetical protein